MITFIKWKRQKVHQTDLNFTPKYRYICNAFFKLRQSIWRSFGKLVHSKQFPIRFIVRLKHDQNAYQT